MITRPVPPVGMVIKCEPQDFVYLSTKTPSLRLIYTTTGWELSTKRRGYLVYLKGLTEEDVKTVKTVRITEVSKSSAIAEVF